MRRTIQFLSILAILAVFFLSVGAVSISFNQCMASEGQAHRQNSNNENEASFQIQLASDVRCFGEFLDKNNGGITAIATVVIAAFTCTLWLATTRQARLTREIFADDKRAFVFAKDVVWEWSSNGDQFEWRFRPVWENSGDTPTRNLRICTNCELRNSPLPTKYDYRGQFTTYGSGLLGPHTTMQGGTAPPENPITPQDILDVSAGRKFLYLMGIARYNDVFPRTPEHVTVFCWQILPMGKPNLFDPDRPTQNQSDRLRFPFIHNTEGNETYDEAN